MGTILSGITVLLCLICVRSFPAVINGHHVFRDFLIGDTACDGVNRLGEWKLETSGARKRAYISSGSMGACGGSGEKR